MISHKKNLEENLTIQWKQMRSYYFNVCNEDMIKFEKKFSSHPLYHSVISHFDKNFKQINQIVKHEVKNYIKQIN